MISKQFEIEIFGAFKTIQDYTNDPFTLGYIQAYKKSAKNNDYEMMKLALLKLKKFYKDNLDEILSNNFVSNKENHINSKDLINNILNYINSNQI